MTTSRKVALAFIVLGFLAGLATPLLGSNWFGLRPFWVIGGVCFVVVFVLRLREIRDREQRKQ
jgi:uncharacterized membrane protein YbhN (UPF0104 family)